MDADDVSKKLDPDLLAFVKAMARYAARKDHNVAFIGEAGRRAAADGAERAFKMRALIGMRQPR